MRQSTRDPGAPRLELAGIDDDTQTSAQEAVPVRMVFGENVLPAQWISTIYNQFAREAPAGKQGKK